MTPAPLLPTLAQVAQVQRNWILEGLIVAVLMGLAIAAVVRQSRRE